MPELPRKAVARTARLAALPLGYAGRNALGLGKRLGGRPAEAVMNEIQQRTAEQLFRTLGELKGGAMKFGQAMSVLEAALPDELVAPYRTELTRLQDSAPPMPTQTVRDQIAHDLGAGWRDQLVWLDGGPTAAASIGQVHQGRWSDGREVAVKVQYPGAGAALTSDLRQLARLARTLGPLIPGIEVKPLVAELQARATDELDYTLEAQAQHAFADAYRDDPELVVPDVVAVGHEVLVTEWLESPASLASVIRDGTQEERDHYGELFVRFLFDGPARTGMLHADPHPGNFRILPNADGSPGRLGVLDFGAVARLPDGGLPEAMGRLIRIAGDREPDELVTGLRDEGFIKPGVDIDPALVLDYLSPFVEPTLVERFRFSREWMQGQFNRLHNPQEPAYTIALKLNLPPAYLLIHRTWLGGIGVLSQLGAEAPFRAILEEYLPGFAD
jgi:predicted unusual protein kinase regulating ubiquinone biosynthesis (AarF/ABC1/UbiB family)